MNKEEVYDSEINPLMAKIIDICREHKIAMLADFRLDEDLQCTTALLKEDFEPSDGQLEALRCLKAKPVFAMAETTETMICRRNLRTLGSESRKGQLK